MKQITLTLLTLSLLFCCQTERNPSYLIDFSALAEEAPGKAVQICTLQENLGYINNNISDFCRLSDTTFVVSCPQAVYLYHTNGEQLKKIGGVGRGGSEYLQCGQLYVSEEYIYVWCVNSLKLIQYHHNGDYKSAYPVGNSAINKFMVVEDSVAYFYQAGVGIHEGYIKAYDLTQRTEGATFGTPTEADKIVAINAGSGALCATADKQVLFLPPAALELYILSGGAITSKQRLKAHRFSMDEDAVAELPQNVISEELFTFLHRNSVVTDVQAFEGKIAVMAEVGEINAVRGPIPSVDFSSRKLCYYEMDSNYNALRQVLCDYPDKMLFHKLINNELYYFVYDEEAHTFVLHTVRL